MGICPYNGILLKNKKEKPADTSNNMDESQNMLSEINETQRVLSV